ncbi:MAG: helix-turn-helix domain-containing protein [Novosphingobium sp.]
MLRDDALDAAISSDIHFQVRSEPSLRANAYQLRVHTSVCPREGHGIYQSPWHLLEATLEPCQPIWNRFLNRTGGEEIRVGSVMFVPRDEPVQCHFTRGARRTISCLFDLNALGFERAAEWNWNDIDPALAFDIRDPFVQVAVQRLRQEVLAPSFVSELQVESALIFLGAQIQRLVEKRGHVEGSDAKALDRMELRRVLERIKDEDGPAPSVGELARMTGLSAPVFSARFRKTTGQTVRSYVAHAKLEKAKALLLDEAEMVKQIAYRCGFTSAAAFAMSFRQETGMTPTEFRTLSRIH